MTALLGWCVCCAEPVALDGAPCSAQHRCPADYLCAGGSCRRLAGGPTIRCDDANACEIGVCLPETGFCVQCRGDGDCIHGACLDGLYQCGCRTHEQCATGRCHLGSATCVSCFDDRQCEGGWCDRDAGVCHRNLDGDDADSEGTGDEQHGTAEDDA